MRVKNFIFAALILLLFINTAAANSARIVDYKLQILDDSSNIIDTYEADVGVYKLIIYNNDVAYATTGAEYIIIDIPSASVIDRIDDSSAEQVLLNRTESPASTFSFTRQQPTIHYRLEPDCCISRITPYNFGHIGGLGMWNFENFSYGSDKIFI